MKLRGFVIGLASMVMLIAASFACVKLSLYVLVDAQAIRMALLGVIVLGIIFMVLLVGASIYYILFVFRLNKNR